MFLITFTLYNCIKESYKKKRNKYFLIFEDDFYFTENWNKEIKNIKYFLENNNNWDTLHLGGLLLKIDKERNNTYRGKVLLTHTYFMSIEGANKILINPIIKEIDMEIYDNIYHLDQFYIKTMRQYILKNAISLQKW